ncbi:MAG: hypothetical protein AAGI12_08500 [Pseudomonadota bacterium]
MIPWERLDSAPMLGGGALRLMRRGAEFSIWLDKTELMNSRLSGSEEALAQLAADRLQHVSAPNVLIGGLGMGFTLRAALAAFGDTTTITSAELVPAVIEWAKGPMSDLFGNAFDDSRSHLHLGDVGPLIQTNPNTYDAILLDVDNGPEGLTRVENDAIYSATGLSHAKRALRPGGVLAVWSSTPNEAFTRRMKQSGLNTEEVRVKANAGKKGTRHVIWLGMK